MKIRKSKRQSAWEFMRRNRNFLAGDVMMITQMSKQNMRQLIMQLKQKNLVEPLSKNSLPFEEKIFFLKDAGAVICPVKSFKKKSA